MSIKISPIEVRYKDKKWQEPRADDVGVLRISQDDNGFEVSFDVAGFNSKELKVKVLQGVLEVHCTPENRPDAPVQGKRSCRLPADLDFSTLRSNLTSVGTLEITCRKY